MIPFPRSGECSISLTDVLQVSEMPQSNNDGFSVPRIHAGMLMCWIPKIPLRYSVA